MHNTMIGTHTNGTYHPIREKWEVWVVWENIWQQDVYKFIKHAGSWLLENQLNILFVAGWQCDSLHKIGCAFRWLLAFSIRNSHFACWFIPISIKKFSSHLRRERLLHSIHNTTMMWIYSFSKSKVYSFFLVLHSGKSKFALCRKMHIWSAVIQTYSGISFNFTWSYGGPLRCGRLVLKQSARLSIRKVRLRLINDLF